MYLAANVRMGKHNTSTNNRVEPEEDDHDDFKFLVTDAYPDIKMTSQGNFKTINKHNSTIVRCKRSLKYNFTII